MSSGREEILLCFMYAFDERPGRPRCKKRLMPRPDGCETGPGVSRSHQEAQPSCARTCKRPSCCSCVGPRHNSTSGRGGSISSSILGRSWKLALRLTSTCSPGCRKADRQSSMHKRSGCGAGRQTCSIDKPDPVWCLREFTLFRFRLVVGESARAAPLPGFYSNVVVKGPSMRRKRKSEYSRRHHTGSGLSI